MKMQLSTGVLQYSCSEIFVSFTRTSTPEFFKFSEKLFGNKDNWIKKYVDILLSFQHLTFLYHLVILLRLIIKLPIHNKTKFHWWRRHTVFFYFEIHHTKSALLINSYYYSKFQLYWDVVTDCGVWISAT